MTIANGIDRQIRFKEEVSWGVAPGTSDGQILRRVNTTLQLTKGNFSSNEIQSNHQRSHNRHGMHIVSGGLDGELSPGTWSDFIQAILRKNWAAIAAMTGLSITIDATAKTITRGSGSWLTDGVKKGLIGRLTAGAFASNNLNTNFRIIGVTATVITYADDAVSALLTSEGPIAAATLTIPGKACWIPLTGHTNKSYYIEDWFVDLAKSEQFSGCKPGTAAIRVPPNNMATIGWTFMGKTMTPGTSAYYTSPAAETTTPNLDGSNGAIRVGAVDQGVVTNLEINVNGQLTNGEVVGSKFTPDVFRGRVLVDGQFTAFFDNTTLRDAFLNETETELNLYLTGSNDANAEFMSVILPRIKINSYTKDDGEKGIIATCQFTALRAIAGGAGGNEENTTIMIHDSAVA